MKSVTFYVFIVKFDSPILNAIYSFFFVLCAIYNLIKLFLKFVTSKLYPGNFCLYRIHTEYVDGINTASMRIG